jgi:hypothetical protein
MHEGFIQNKVEIKILVLIQIEDNLYVRRWCILTISGKKAIHDDNPIDLTT